MANPTWYEEVVPAVLKAVKDDNKTPSIPIKNAMLLIIWAYGEQPPTNYIPSQHKNRLLNVQPTVNEWKLLCPNYMKAPCYASPGVFIYNLPDQLLNASTGARGSSAHFGFDSVYAQFVFCLNRIAGQSLRPGIPLPPYGQINRMLRSAATMPNQFFSSILDVWAYPGYGNHFMQYVSKATEGTKTYVTTETFKLQGTLNQYTLPNQEVCIDVGALDSRTRLFREFIQAMGW